MCSSLSDTEKLELFVVEHPAIARHAAVWAEGSIQLEITTHLVGNDLAPSTFTTSGRCIVLAGDSVLVMRNPGTRHILPGGRVELGEDSRLAVIRELHEETGLIVPTVQPLALMVFRHLTPRPDGYPYPYPIFTNDIFVTRLPEQLPIVSTDDYEQDGEFLSLPEALGVIANHEAQLLQAALVTS